PNGGGSVGIGFAVPVDVAKKIIPELISKGYVSRPWLGVGSFPINARVARAFDLPVTEGLMISNVVRGSGAATAGLRSAALNQDVWGNIVIQRMGDIIVGVDGKKVTSADDLQNALQDKKPGETVQVEVLRDGNQTTIPVRLGERPPQEQ
ncbi:MAG TPA: PDZ domain-containing protein, partial [Blastocatellia bacterium]